MPLRFAGQYHDTETGLYYNYNRYYNPDTGRYITTDPLGLAPSPNPHTYVTNPTTGIDPLGLSEMHGLHDGDTANGVRPTVADARLGRALADDFRGGPNPIGDGSALAAARHTLDTGELVGGSTHLEKAVEMRDRYGRILRRGGLTPADQAIAQVRYDAYSSFVTENALDAMMRARGLR